MIVLGQTCQDVKFSRRSVAELFPHLAIALVEPQLMTSCLTLCSDQVQ